MTLRVNRAKLIRGCGIPCDVTSTTNLIAIGAHPLIIDSCNSHRVVHARVNTDVETQIRSGSAELSGSGKVSMADLVASEIPILMYTVNRRPLHLQCG